MNVPPEPPNPNEMVGPRGRRGRILRPGTPEFDEAMRVAGEQQRAAAEARRAAQEQRRQLLIKQREILRRQRQRQQQMQQP